MSLSCKRISVVNLSLVVLMVFSLSGCMFNSLSKGPEQEPANGIQPKTRKTTAVYYDFEDVLIPMELTLVDDRTVVVSTPGFTSGIIALKGRIERRVLFNFFNKNMQKDNWNVVSQIKSPGTTIMVFQKSARTSVITIRDEQFYTYVEVGVAPTVSDGTAFTEPAIME